MGDHTITVTKSDHVGKLKRSQDIKNANDDVRAAFKNAIIEMFGDESKIPEDVKKAMLLKDYGVGKPLTARRILAVKAAVEKYANRMDPAVETAKTNASWVYNKQGVDPQQVDELIKTAVKTCIGDQDALDVVMKTMGNIIMRGDDTLRSPEDVRKKVDAILTNVVELRDAAKGDPSIMKHGKTFLMTLDGKSLKPDVMTQLVQKAKTMKVDKIKSLSASSNATAIHKAIRQFTDNVNSVLNDSGASKVLEGGDERDAGRDFLIGLMSDKCGKSAARNIQAALNSPKAALLYRIYDDIETKKITLGDFSEALGEYVAQQGDVCSNMMNQLKYMVDSECGIPLNRFKEVEKFDGDMNYAEVNIGVITSDIEKAARARMERERKEYLDSKVVGEGPAADAFKDMIEKRLGPEAFDPNQIIRDQSCQNSKSCSTGTSCPIAKNSQQAKAATLFLPRISNVISM